MGSEGLARPEQALTEAWRGSPSVPCEAGQGCLAPHPRFLPLRPAPSPQTLHPCCSCSFAAITAGDLATRRSPIWGLDGSR